MPRFLLGVASALLTLAPAGQAQGPGFPQQPTSTFQQPKPFGSADNPGLCPNCHKPFTWSGGGHNMPSRCPNCGVRVTSVDYGPPGTGDGGRDWWDDLTPSARRNAVRLVVTVVVFVVALAVGLIKLAMGGGSRPPRKKLKKRKRRPVEEDDGDDAPPPRRDRPRADGKSVPMATLADDSDYEVVGDAPAPTPEPPRRAKAKLIPPDGGPR